jgi:hypothetical protein
LLFQLKCCIQEWAMGQHKNVPWTGDVFAPDYAGMMEMISQVQVHLPWFEVPWGEKAMPWPALECMQCTSCYTCRHITQSYCIILTVHIPMWMVKPSKKWFQSNIGLMAAPIGWDNYGVLFMDRGRSWTQDFFHDAVLNVS